MRKKTLQFFIVFLAFLCNNLLFAQDKLIPAVSLPIAAELFSTDNLGNIFTLNKGVISKYDNTGKLLNVYQNKAALLNFIDASNPLRIIGYSQAYSTIYFFNSQLALQSSVDLHTMFNGDPQLVCNSATGNFWLYDRSLTVLSNYNDQLAKITESQPLNLTIPVASDIIAMKENEKWLVLLTVNNSFLVFNNNGSYYKTINANNAFDFEITNKALITIDSSAIQMLSIASDESVTILDGTFTVSNTIRFYRDTLYVKKSDNIDIYKLNK
jgi:hypothetical protein